MDGEKVIKGLEDSLANQGCGYMDGVGELYAVSGEDLQNALAMLKEQEHKDKMYHALEEDWKKLKELLKEQQKQIKALRLLVEWAEECDFGFDQFPDEYERYKDEITDMKYIDGMIHVAMRTLEDHGEFAD